MQDLCGTRNLNFPENLLGERNNLRTVSPLLITPNFSSDQAGKIHTMSPTAFLTVLPRLLALLALTSIVSCRIPNVRTSGGLLEIAAALPVEDPPPPAPPLYDWRGDEVSGPLRIAIDLSEQKAQIYRGAQHVGWTYVATGRAGFASPQGNFRILDKIADKVSNRYGVIVNAEGTVIDGDAKVGRESIPRGGRFVGAPMPHWMRLTTYGIGMHEGPIPNPGSPASHGCIRLPGYIAEKLFAHSVIGTKVTISP